MQFVTETTKENRRGKGGKKARGETVGIVNRIDDFYPSVFVAIFSFVCRNFGGTNKCELMC
jgi:hypothetical protein